MAQPHLDNLLDQKLQLFEQIKSRFGEPTEKANESFAAKEVSSREQNQRKIEPPREAQETPSFYKHLAAHQFSQNRQPTDSKADDSDDELAYQLNDK